MRKRFKSKKKNLIWTRMLGDLSENEIKKIETISDFGVNNLDNTREVGIL